jgi:hypothetical protein
VKPLPEEKVLHISEPIPDEVKPVTMKEARALVEACRNGEGLAMWRKLKPGLYKAKGKTYDPEGIARLNEYWRHCKSDPTYQQKCRREGRKSQGLPPLCAMCRAQFRQDDGKSRLYKCGGCMKEYYCCNECKRSHRKVHKPECDKESEWWKKKNEFSELAKKVCLF